MVKQYICVDSGHEKRCWNYVSTPDKTLDGLLLLLVLDPDGTGKCAQDGDGEDP